MKAERSYRQLVLYSRDKKRNKLQIEYGVITTKEGLPLGVKVFNGNTSDLASFRSVIEDIKTTHKLEKPLDSASYLGEWRQSVMTSKFPSGLEEGSLKPSIPTVRRELI